MDKLSIFRGAEISGEVSLASEDNKTFDDAVAGLESIAKKTEKVLEQLRVTHLGHEEQDWGKEYKAEDLLLDVDETEEA